MSLAPEAICRVESNEEGEALPEPPAPVAFLAQTTLAVDGDEHFALPREFREVLRNVAALLGAAAFAPTAAPAPVPALDGRDLKAVNFLAALG